MINFGDLRKTTPVSREFGFDRGKPIDRYYIEQFLAQQATAIHGTVLEIGDDSYTRQFGGNRVSKREVLHVIAGNPAATIIADLTDARPIADNTFDCCILTQTLQFIYEAEAAVKTVYRILKPGGVALVTFPGISQISTDLWAADWYWSFTTLSAREMFGSVFSESQLQFQTYGNRLSATAFLQGLASDELTQSELDTRDPETEMLIAVRAQKPEDRSTQP